MTGFVRCSRSLIVSIFTIYKEIQWLPFTEDQINYHSYMLQWALYVQNNKSVCLLFQLSEYTFCFSLFISPTREKFAGLVAGSDIQTSQLSIAAACVLPIRWVSGDIRTTRSTYEGLFRKMQITIKINIDMSVGRCGWVTLYADAHLDN